MNGATSHGLDIYMRYTDTAGKTTVREQRVWDKDRFVTARQADAAKENDKASGPKLAAAQQITRDQYLKER